MSRPLVVVLRSITVAAWIMAAVDISPWWFDLREDRALFVIAAGCVGAYAMISRAHARPAVDLYVAGKAVGRREALLEQECENVRRLSDASVPDLRIVNGGR